MAFRFRKFVLMDPAGDAGAGAGGGAATTGAGTGDAGAGKGAAGSGTAGAAGTGDAGASAQPKGFWADDWREQYSGQDADRLKELQRYQSPKAALDGLFAAKQRIRSGELAPRLKPNATPEEIASYRQTNGIPEAPDKYDIKLGNDRKIDETDRPMIDKLVAKLHGVHATPEMVNAAVDTFYDIEESVLAEQEQSDAQALRETEDALRAEWGGEYRRNIGIVTGLLDSAPAGIKDALMNARGPDGITLLNNAAMMNWLVEMSRQINPVASLMPGVQNPQQALGDELANIKKMMGDRNSDYWKGPKSAQLQERFRQLVTAQQRNG